MAQDFSKLAGSFVWIWNWPNCDGGNVDAVDARLRAAGARGVLIKATDAAHWFDQGIAVSVLVQELRARGYVVGTWGYNYDANEPGEAQIEALTIALAAPDVAVCDVEAEFEAAPNAPADAMALTQALSAAAVKVGTELAYAPLPAVRYHPRLPYYQFSDAAGFACIPQLYWTSLGWSWSYTNQFFFQDVGTYGLSGPFFPAYQDSPGAQPAAADVVAWAQDIKARGCQGFSVWSYEHLDAGGWDRFAQAAKVFADVAPPPPQKQPWTEGVALKLCGYIGGGSGPEDIGAYVAGYWSTPAAAPVRTVDP